MGTIAIIKFVPPCRLIMWPSPRNNNTHKPTCLYYSTKVSVYTFQVLDELNDVVPWFTLDQIFSELSQQEFQEILPRPLYTGADCSGGAQVDASKVNFVLVRTEEDMRLFTRIMSSHPLLLVNLYMGTWIRGGVGIRRSHFIDMAHLKAELWLVCWDQNKHGGRNESLNTAFEYKCYFWHKIN